MSGPAPIRHPGPVAQRRHASARAEPVALGFTIEAGETVEAGLGRGLTQAGCDSAYVEMRDAAMNPFRYVLPAASPDPDHAAWYSATHAPEGKVRIGRAGAIVGRRDGAPFLHCHGFWRMADGTLALGHMLPDQSVAAEEIAVRGIGLRGAIFQSRQDAETNFRLFSAESTTESGQGAALAVTLRPNQDITIALEDICADAGIERGSIHGIGSLNEARFQGGRVMHSFASEFLIMDGRVTRDGDSIRVALDIAIVALDGSIYRGDLVRGENPICITSELVIVPEGAKNAPA